MPELEKKQLTQKEYQDMLQIGTVDVGNNTLFAKCNKVAIDKTRVKLIISSGGSGAAAIKEAIHTAEQKLETDFSRYMKFVLVDSAKNEIEGSRQQMENDILCTFNTSVSGAQERMVYSNRQNFFRTWVPRDYNVTQLNEDGSGRDRMTGKIKFYDASEGTFVDVKFRQLIRDFYSEDATLNKLPVDIMILAGVSGGNGSGTFLDLAAHARKACRQAGVTETIRVFGYLFLPDVVENFERNNLDIKNQLHANGYAALKELESYMDIPFSPERKEIFTSRNVNEDDIVVDTNHPLYNFPILISGDYYETKSMMAECIINLALQNNGGFDQNSFYSNTETMRTNYLTSPARLNAGLLTADSFPEDSHRYAGIGYAYASIPEKIITANVVSNVCRKMYEPDPLRPGDNTCFCTTERRLSRTEMENVIRRLFNFDSKNEVKTESFWDEKIVGTLKQLSKLSENTRTITRQEINAGETNTYKTGFHKVEKVNAGKEAIKDHLQVVMNTFIERAALVLKDYGPRVMEYLYKGIGPNDQDGNTQSFADISIQKMLEYAKGQLQSINEDGKKGVEPSYVIPNGLGEMIFRRRIEQWRHEFHSAVEYQTKQEIVKSMLEMQGPWSEIIENPIRNYVNQCTEFAKRLETLSDFYKSEGNVLEDASYERFVERSQQDNCVSLCNDAKVYKWVKMRVDQKIKSIPVAEVKTALIDDFVNNQKAWNSVEEGITRKAFDGVMANCCKLGIGAVGGDGLSLTATAYFNYVLEQVPPAQVQMTADRIVEDIVDKLMQRSKPSIKKEHTNTSVVNQFMMIPQSIEASPNGKAIITAFENAWNRTGAVEGGITLSPSVSDIVCYQTSVANGICDLRDIGQWEKAYYACNSSSIHLSNGEYGSTFIERTKTQIDEEKATKSGVPFKAEKLTAPDEIIFGRGLSWRHYPPLDLKNSSRNVKEQEFMREIFNPIVDFAIEERIIERREIGLNTYQYVMHVIPENWSNLDVSAYNVRNEDGEYVLGEGLFRYLRNLNPLGDQEYTKEIRLSGSGYFDAPYDFTEARNAGDGKSLAVIEDISMQYMKRILRRNTWLFLQLRDTLNRYYPIWKVMNEKVRSVEMEIKVSNFLKYFIYGLISEEKNVWYVAMDHESKLKRPFCKFEEVDTVHYTPFEKKLKRDWKMILAVMKLAKQDYAPLKEMLNELLMAKEEEEIVQIKAENRSKLISVYKQIQEKFAQKWPKRELFKAIERELEPSSEADNKYVSLIETLNNLIESEVISDEPEPSKPEPSKPEPSKPEPSKPESPKPELKDTWNCECGISNLPMNLDKCPVCGKENPLKKPPVPTTWDCECGIRNLPMSLDKCPVCGKENPLKKPSVPTTWDCECGIRNLPMSLDKCPICNTQNPWKKEAIPENWDCEGCGISNLPISLEKCPICGAKNPWK